MNKLHPRTNTRVMADGTVVDYIKSIQQGRLVPANPSVHKLHPVTDLILMEDGTVVSELETLLAAIGSGGGSGTGPTGADGKSAYQIAVDNGFVGDEQAWLNSLVGAQGPAGADGSDASVTIADNLTTTDSTHALAAPQGKALDDKIEAHAAEIATDLVVGHVKGDGRTVTIDPDGSIIANPRTTAVVVNNLTTDSDIDAVSAAQAKILKDELDTIKSGTWVEGTLLNGWTGTIQYKVSGLGVVTISINAVVGNTTANARVSTLPDSIIPKNNIVVPLHNGSNGSILPGLVIGIVSKSLVCQHFTATKGSAVSGIISYQI